MGSYRGTLIMAMLSCLATPRMPTQSHYVGPSKNPKKAKQKRQRQARRGRK